MTNYNVNVCFTTFYEIRNVPRVYFVFNAVSSYCIFYLALLRLRPLPFSVFALLALLCFVLHCMDCICFCSLCIISLSVSLLDISRTLIINYRWPAAIGLVPLWQPAKSV